MCVRYRVAMIGSALSFAAVVVATAAVGAQVSIPGRAADEREFSQTLAARSQSALEGTWSGTVQGAGELRVSLVLAKSGDRWSGDLRLPDYGVVIPLTRIRVSGDSVSIGFKEKIDLGDTTITGYVGTLDARGSTLIGSLGGDSRPLLLTRDDDVGKPAGGIGVELVFPPAVFRADDKTHVVYELRCTNTSLSDISVDSIQITGSPVVDTYTGCRLRQVLPDPRIPGATSRHAYMWITLNQGAEVPTSLHHKVTFDDRTFKEVDVVIVPAPPLVLGPPLRGEGWVAGNGPDNESTHRRAVVRIGDARFPSRFATDWRQYWPDGRQLHGNPKENTSYSPYGAEVVAVADAVVVSTKDGIAENVPGARSRAVPITLETIAGNNVILDLGEGRYATYAHLQPGSVNVKAGDRVVRGQLLGRVGNSGNSTGPHLHFQVSNGASALASEGVPYVIDSFGVRDKNKRYQPRQMELPLANQVVRFP